MLKKKSAELAGTKPEKTIKEKRKGGGGGGVNKNVEQNNIADYKEN